MRRRFQLSFGFVACLVFVFACGPDLAEPDGDPAEESADSALAAGDVCQIALQGGSATLSCPAGQVITQIKYASFGDGAGGCANLVHGSCHAYASEREVETRCLDRASCVVPANARTFYDPCPGTYKRLKVVATCGTPALRPFYRREPFLGTPIQTIPDYVKRSDFPYHPRPWAGEIPFGDGGTVVRLLGGVGKKGSEQRDQDLITRNTDLSLTFHPDRLRARLDPYRTQGYGAKDMVLVLDNTPWDLTDVPVYDSYGNRGVPGLASDGSYNPTEWGNFIEALATELKTYFGEEQANFLRFRVGTEYRFAGTEDQYFTHYDYAAGAIRKILPGAHISGPNDGGVSIATLDAEAISPYRVASHVLTQPNRRSGVLDTRFDFFAASRYIRLGSDLDANVQVLTGGYQEFGRRYPALAYIPLEVQEWGPQPWNSPGYWPTSEPGPWGTAQLLQLLIRFQQAGARVSHWGVSDSYRDQKNVLQSMFVGTAFAYQVLDAMVGGEPWTAQADVYPSPQGARYVGLGSRLADRSIFFFTGAYPKETASEISENVTFRFPSRLVEGRPTLSFVRLDRASSPHQAIRDDLAAAGKLDPAFVARPGRLGGITEMEVAGSDAESTVVGPKRAVYEDMYVQSLTLKPLTNASLSIANGEAVLTVAAKAPSVMAVVFNP